MHSAFSRASAGRPDVRVRKSTRNAAFASRRPGSARRRQEVRRAFARMPRQVGETGLPLAAASRLELRATVRVTVDNDTLASYSSRNRSWMRVVVCRCLRRSPGPRRACPRSRAATRRSPNHDVASRAAWPTVVDLEYLRTVGSRPLSLRAIDKDGLTVPATRTG